MSLAITTDLFPHAQWVLLVHDIAEKNNDKAVQPAVTFTRERRWKGEEITITTHSYIYYTWVQSGFLCYKGFSRMCSKDVQNFAVISNSPTGQCY